MAGQGADLFPGVRIAELDVLPGRESQNLAVGPERDSDRLARLRAIAGNSLGQIVEGTPASRPVATSQILAIPSVLTVASRLPSAV